ncbi:hypothetical protein Rctr197k_161 [Virus Rctr197k]|nr:hypothetical protein Rctr197k_161 [Virus Rctr197k]
MTKTKFTIDRSKWRCGGADTGTNFRGKGPTSLLNADGFQCCLGQIASQCGYRPSALLGLNRPDEVLVNGGGRTRFPFLAKRTEGGAAVTALAENAIELNDTSRLTDEERELRLVELFQRHGFTLIFEGDYV